jgi:hypothetical protein
MSSACLAEERGFGAEEIAARFGVTPHVVRHRLRLGAVSPKLMRVYREGDLALEQLMAFAITDDHARQEGVYERLSYNRDASSTRRPMNFLMKWMPGSASLRPRSSGWKRSGRPMMLTTSRGAVLS